VTKKKKSSDLKGLQTFLEGCGLSSRSIERAVEVRNAELPKSKKSSKLERLSHQLRKEAKD
jgi:hypothetical protein